MAHSIQQYAGRTEVFNDANLLVVMGFAVHEAQQSPDFESIEGIVEEWRKAMLHYGPGVIDLKLDAMLQGTDERRVLGVLLAEILRKVSLYEEIPAVLLNEKC